MARTQDYKARFWSSSRFAACAAASVVLLSLAAGSVSAEPVLRGYWTFDTDTVESGTITESAGYVSAGTHDGKLIYKLDEDGNPIPGVTFNSISGEAGNHLSSGNYISFTNDAYAVIQNTSTVTDNEALLSPNYQNTYDFVGSAFTISAWVKGQPDGNWEPYISKYGETYGYQLRRNGSTTTPTFTYRISGGDDDPSVNMPVPTPNLNDGNWHNLIAVYGGTYRELYMDGQLITRITDTAASAGGQGEPMVFSGRYHGGSAAYQAFANISLDDVAIYSGALRNNQISYLSSGGDPTQINQNVPDIGTKTIDIGLNSASGGDGVKLTRNGNISRTWLDTDMTFDGQSSFIRTNLPVGSAGLNGSFTASAWVNLDSLSGDQSIFGNNASGTNVGLHLIVRSGHPHMGFYGNDLQASNVTLETGKWYYLTYQYDADNQSQTLYLNGEQIATRTGSAAFAGTNVIDLGTAMGGNYLHGKLKGVTITDGVLSASQIQSQMNASGNNTKAVETFAWGINRDEWYSGGGASLGNAWKNGTLYTALSMYHAPTDAAEKTIVDQVNSDKTTGMVWGPQFSVLENAPADAVISVDVLGGATALNVNSRGSGGGGIALWDLTTSDYVRDSSKNIISYAGNGSNDLQHHTFSLNGLQGHDLMVVAIDRNTGGWGWVGLTNLEADTTQVSNIEGSGAHHIVLNDFNFDTAGEFSGMYEVDADGNRLDSVTHFTNGSRNGSAATNFYVDSSGTFDKGNKGFLSSGTAAYGEEQTTGILRSEPFLVQGDILEYYIAGGNNINNKHMDLVDADTGEVYFSVTGENANDFRYDFLNLKDVQGKSVYLRIVDSDGGSSWSHLELDQIRQVKFAPTELEVLASENGFHALTVDPNKTMPGFNAEVYDLGGTGITSLDDLANYITSGVEPTEKCYRYELSDFMVANSGINATAQLNVESSGQYTLAVASDGAYRIVVNGESIFESDGSENLEFIPLTFNEVGVYSLEMLYMDENGTGASIYSAEGALDSWNDSFTILNGFVDGNINSYANYFVGSEFVPEPSTWALLVFGVGLGFWMRKKRV